MSAPATESTATDADSSADAAVAASSVDGRVFACTMPIESRLAPGDLVVLIQHGETPAPRLLGQLLTKVADGAAASGEGRLVGTLDAGGVPQTGRAAGRIAPFAHALVEPAPAATVAALQAAAGASLPLATGWLGDDEIPIMLRPAGFNRHTFLCGQSGSGKTYGLGVLLEQLLLHTRLQMVIIDPNGDFVRLGEQLPGADEAAAAALREQHVRVLRSGPDEGDLCVRMVDLEPAAKAALMHIDPMADREEYNLALRLFDQYKTQSGQVSDLTALLHAGKDPAERDLALRIENLDLANRDTWAVGRTSLNDVVDERPRATVLDVSGMQHAEEASLVAVSLLDHLWARREERRPVLVVIDEAHNVCAAEPSGPLQALATERLIQIAGEGRKYGIWLLLSTQRPSKIHPNVLSQCDNLMLMRMNSPGDLAELEAVFGFAPSSMLAASPAFRQGEMLLAGTFVPVPTFARSGVRLTPEGGSDVSVPLV